MIGLYGPLARLVARRGAAALPETGNRSRQWRRFQGSDGAILTGSAPVARAPGLSDAADPPGPPGRWLAIQLAIAMWIVIAALMGLAASLSEDIFLIGGAVSLGVTVGIGIFTSFLVYLLLGRLKGLGRLSASLSGMAGIFGIAALNLALDYAIHRYLIFPAAGGPAPSTVSAAWMFQIYLINVAAHACYAAAFSASSLSRRAQDQQVQLVQAEHAQSRAQLACAEAQMKLLHLQLNPHFMVNSLNAVSGLVLTGRGDDAIDMADKLSDFLRASMQSGGQVETPLADELHTASVYLGIESARFGDRLRVEFNCAADIGDALIPSFILQPLIENAIRHGLNRAIQAVTIRVESRRDGADLVVTVSDDAPRAADACAVPAGRGLASIRARLDLHYGPAAGLRAEQRDVGFLSEIRLPYRSGAGGISSLPGPA